MCLYNSHYSWKYPTRSFCFLENGSGGSLDNLCWFPIQKIPHCCHESFFGDASTALDRTSHRHSKEYLPMHLSLVMMTTDRRRNCNKPLNRTTSPWSCYYCSCSCYSLSTLFVPDSFNPLASKINNVLMMCLQYYGSIGLAVVHPPSAKRWIDWPLGLH